MASQINVVLVHGAWADAFASWSKVIPLLWEKGLKVAAVQLPLTSLADDITVVKNALSSHAGPTAIVGHSYGGAVITGAADGMPNVKALVYITAFGLAEGESLESLSQQGPPPAGARFIKPDAHGFLWIDREGFATAFAADVDPAYSAVMAVTQKPLSLKSFADKAGPPAWKHIPSWYLVSEKDHMIPPAAQQFMAARMKATVRSVDASHASMASHPKEVADIISSAALTK
jgi:pimeloyl-ACP methyl ester carboxylesterase